MRCDYGEKKHSTTNTKMKSNEHGLTIPINVSVSREQVAHINSVTGGIQRS